MSHTNHLRTSMVPAWEAAKARFMVEVCLALACVPFLSNPMLSAAEVFAESFAYWDRVARNEDR